MKSDSERLAETIRLIAATWPNWKLTADTIDVYMKYLARFPIGDVEEAVDLLIASEDEFAPTPGKIATLIAERQLGLPSVEHAIEMVNAAVSPWDQDAYARLAEPVRRAVKALGGVTVWRESAARDSRWEFRRFYSVFRREAVMQIAAPGLPGDIILAEIEGGPMLLGDVS